MAVDRDHSTSHTGGFAMLVMMAILPACARTPEAATTPSATPASKTTLYQRIPDQIGDFTLRERTTVRGLPTDSIFRYRDTSKTILSVIVYDVPAEVKVGADSQAWTHREGERFREVQEIQRQRGFLADYTVAFSDSVRVVAGRRSFVEHRIATPVRFRNGAIAVDMQFLYLIDGRFVKVRATIPGQGWEQSQVPNFARQLATRLASDPSSS